MSSRKRPSSSSSYAPAGSGKRTPSHGGRPQAGSEAALVEREPDGGGAAAYEVEVLVKDFEAGGREDDALSHTPERADVYLSFLQDGTRAGIAFYATDTCRLSVTSAYCGGEADVPYLLETLRRQIARPTLVIASSQVSETARAELAKAAAADEGDGAGSGAYEDAVPVTIAKHSTFQLDLARRLLQAVRTPQQSVEGGGGTALLPVQGRLASMLDLSDAAAVRAAGGLLHFLARNRVINELEDDDAPLVLHGGLRMFSLHDFMHIDALTFTGEWEESMGHQHRARV
jgi:hypothetical protein